MDDDGLNMRNWGYYDLKEPLGFQPMSPMGDHRDKKPFLFSRENPVVGNLNGTSYHHSHSRVASEPHLPSHCVRDSWIERDRLYHMHPGNTSFSSGSNASTRMVTTPVDLGENSEVVERDSGGGGSGKRRGSATSPKASRSKKPKKNPSTPNENGNSTGRRKTVKRNVEVVISGIDMDITGIPIPVCSCTGAPQQCYRWGCGGWQSACCTTTISMYPLPISTKRRGARIAGRKMSQGAFKKVLEKLASEGYDFASAIDLRTYWAKHGTNKFVTIR